MRAVRRCGARISILASPAVSAATLRAHRAHQRFIHSYKRFCLLLLSVRRRRDRPVNLPQHALRAQLAELDQRLGRRLILLGRAEFRRVTVDQLVDRVAHLRNRAFQHAAIHVFLANFAQVSVVTL